MSDIKASCKLSRMAKKDRPVEVTLIDDFKMSKQNRREHDRFIKKAEAGDQKAWEEVGMDYLLGLGAERNTDKAYECFLKSGAEAEVWEHMGSCYFCGVGCEKNLDRAAECYRKAADMGNKDAVTALSEIENI